MKKPLFWVEKEGYPLTPSVFAFADSHVTEFDPPFVPLYAFAGLDRPLTFANGLWLCSPGLDHPPPGRGDGLRDKDIGRFGVPGMVSRVCGRDKR